MISPQALAAKNKKVMAECCDNVLDAVPEIVEALITAAKSGSCVHAKFLFDLAGAIPKVRKEEDDEDVVPGPSLAEILMERLHLEPPAADALPETPGARHFSNGSATSTSAAESV